MSGVQSHDPIPTSIPTSAQISIQQFQQLQLQQQQIQLHQMQQQMQINPEVQPSIASNEVSGTVLLPPMLHGLVCATLGPLSPSNSLPFMILWKTMMTRS